MIVNINTFDVYPFFLFSIFSKRNRFGIKKEKTIGVKKVSIPD